jgi:putative peptidoglycan lipid II flippase
LVALFAIAAVLLGVFAYWWEFVRPVSDALASSVVVRPTAVDVFPRDVRADVQHESALGNAIDGDPGTAWQTDTYMHGEPFPSHKPGVGLLLKLSGPKVITAVDVTVTSTDTAVQINSSSSSSPNTLSDTTQLTQAKVLQPGHSTRFRIGDNKPVFAVVVWISTLGTLNGSHQAAISEIKLFAKQ